MINLNNKPEPLSVDGERFEICGEDNPDIYPHVYGPRMSLSPYEAEELRDWLTQFLEWYYKEKDI